MTDPAGEWSGNILASAGAVYRLGEIRVHVVRYDGIPVVNLTTAWRRAYVVDVYDDDPHRIAPDVRPLTSSLVINVSPGEAREHAETLAGWAFAYRLMDRETKGP